MRTEEARPVRLEDYRPPDWLVETVELDVSLDPRRRGCAQRCALRPTRQGRAGAARARRRRARAARAALDGAPLAAERFAATADRLTIAQPPQRPFRLEIETVVDPSANTQLMGLYRSGAIYCTQCEAEGFRRITYFPDRPDVMAVYTTRIEADKAEAPVLLANGNLVAAGDVPGTGRHFAVWHDPFPKPSYLFALVGGDLACVEDRFVTMSGREVDAAHLCRARQGGAAPTRWTRSSAPMRWDETAFGREYDLDVFMIVAVSDFNMGAMENKGLNIFNDKYVLAEPETATDADFASDRGDHRARVFPQLDRQPHHLPRLVPALPEGRPDGLPRPGILRRPALAPVERIADVRGLRAQQFAEDAGAAGPSGAAAPSTSRSTTSTRRRSTRRAPRSCA